MRTPKAQAPRRRAQMKPEKCTAAKRLTAKGRATTQIIVGDGLTGLSVDKVRLQAEVSGSQLSHYFDDKSALVRPRLAVRCDIPNQLGTRDRAIERGCADCRRVILAAGFEQLNPGRVIGGRHLTFIWVAPPKMVSN